MKVPSESEVKGQVVVAAALFSLNMQKDDLHRGQTPNITISPDVTPHRPKFSSFSF